VFTAEDMRSLLTARPFVAFRLVLSDGGTVEVRSPEVATVGRRCSVIGLLDPDAKDTFFDRWIVVWHMHVTRAEHLDAGRPPFGPPVDPAQSPTPSPV
jgi:hypothetical protein